MKAERYEMVKDTSFLIDDYVKPYKSAAYWIVGTGLFGGGLHGVDFWYTHGTAAIMNDAGLPVFVLFVLGILSAVASGVSLSIAGAHCLVTTLRYGQPRTDVTLPELLLISFMWLLPAFTVAHILAVIL